MSLEAKELLVVPRLFICLKFVFIYLFAVNTSLFFSTYIFFGNPADPLAFHFTMVMA